jgi:hypothetical protein
MADTDQIAPGSQQFSQRFVADRDKYLQVALDLAEGLSQTSKSEASGNHTKVLGKSCQYDDRRWAVG